MNTLRKLGGFFTAFGVFLLGLFLFSDIAKQPEFGLLLAGMGSVAVGILILVTNPAPKPEANPRFRLVRGRKSEPQPKGPPGGEKPAPGGSSKGGGGEAGGPQKSGAAPAKTGGPPARRGGAPAAGKHGKK